MNAELDQLWRFLGDWQALGETILMISDPEIRARYQLEVAKLRKAGTVTGAEGGPVLIQLKQL